MPRSSYTTQRLILHINDDQIVINRRRKMSISLCNIADIQDPGSKAFKVSSNGQTRDIFIVHKDGQFHAYINSCPHTGVNLEWQEDQFLDIENNFIQCSTHDALFEIDSGNCVAGPCAGDHLTAVELDIMDDTLYVDPF